jgi:His/Glu/Gln/Arg/opine family amino acid ABC transporter permease subunit
MDWEVIFRPESLAMYGEGIVTTLWLLITSLVVGAVLALLFALALTGPWKWLQRIVGAYTFVIRGTPLLIQVYMIYYGLGQRCLALDAFQGSGILRAAGVQPEHRRLHRRNACRSDPRDQCRRD